ncbi:MAG: bifunctional DNA-formamidopyrimidine glycosylase/DNA-(apurinic or apyrimidinic site) lyase [Gemmataceae bacterium]|nr:bifunctional DNA-formamidopyrimidine glycosylase/DNA-(apurinic or apyrimidinic site) lyase [Gemmataceae bacterium]MCI0740738.1 bifunctional DNA-formamidopyrimidine glycosylase/DNA-(apurinic or apyrimidinic site) lyase [Gemmataceae bacterium]
MPELPEVETVVRDLRGPLVGKRIAALVVSRKALRRPWRRAWNKSLIGRMFRSVERRGKWIMLDVEGPMLLVHLGMTGQFTVCSAEDPRQDHTHLVFSLDKGGMELRFRDIRRFGSATLFPDLDALTKSFVEDRLGPEPFDLDPVYWRQALAKTSRNLKAILLDQRVVAGVGNIYADESLFEARLHPTRLGKNLKLREIDRLREAIVAVLSRAIERRGSSIRDYVGGSGLQGKYQDEFRVYGRTDEDCWTCGTAITQFRLAGRSTHCCPRCQK